MLKKFIAGSVLAQAFTRHQLSGPERLAQSGLAKATTPDQLIVAHILHSVVTQHDNWRWYAQRPMPEFDLKKNYTRNGEIPYEARTDSDYVLVGPNMKIRFVISTDGSRPGWYVTSKVTVHPSITLDTESGNLLTTRLGQLWKELAEAKNVAEQAKRAMELNEAKWNLAESLLGMKRNEHGALVPKEESCS